MLLIKNSSSYFILNKELRLGRPRAEFSGRDPCRTVDDYRLVMMVLMIRLSRSSPDVSILGSFLD